MASRKLCWILGACVSAVPAVGCSARDLSGYNAGPENNHLVASGGVGANGGGAGHGGAGASGGTSGSTGTGGQLGGAGGTAGSAGASGGAAGSAGAGGGAAGSGGVGGAVGGSGGTGGGSGGSAGATGGTGGCAPVASNTGWKVPLGVDDIEQGPAWSNYPGLQVSDNAYASASFASPGKSRALVLDGLGFLVPANATVTGIEVELELAAGKAGMVTDANVFLISAGAMLGADKGYASWPTVDTKFLYGSATDTWGVSSISPATVNASGFGLFVRIQCLAPSCVPPVEARIDLIRMRVHFLKACTP